MDLRLHLMFATMDDMDVHTRGLLRIHHHGI